MATPASESAGIAIGASGWLAGVISSLTSANQLFQQLPILGFITMGLLGGFAGWALLIELGKLDGRTNREYACVLVRRIGLGLAIGTAMGVYWIYSQDTGQGLWMLAAGIVATAPVELSTSGINLVVEVVRARIGRNGGQQG